MVYLKSAGAAQSPDSIRCVLLFPFSPFSLCRDAVGDFLACFQPTTGGFNMFIAGKSSI